MTNRDSEHRIVHADCMSPEHGLPSLADGSVDHVITDPPYAKDLYLRFRTNRLAVGEFGARGHKEELRRYVEMENDRIGGVSDNDIATFAAEFLRIAKRWIAVFCDIESAHLWAQSFGDTYVRQCIWLKANPMPQITGDRPAMGYEPFVLAHAPGMRKRWNGHGRPNVWRSAGEPTATRPNHPCPKPVKLMSELIRDFTDPGELIVDPFAGSGTTLVAAKRYGRRCLGFERDEAYARGASERLRATTRDLFATVDHPQHEQVGLFDDEPEN